ncbi:MAG: hypothetical protein ACRER8_25045, partial [Pseudomonas sp.]|uniref:hypothetical protein n=1 Tax=Pseudomonas sp. TaxID=306 RepID=UPI003D6E06BD
VSTDESSDTQTFASKPAPTRFAACRNNSGRYETPTAAKLGIPRNPKALHNTQITTSYPLFNPIPTNYLQLILDLPTDL